MKTHSPNPAPMLSPQAVTWAGLMCNGALGAAKVLAGLLCHSQAILADGLHSASDLITDVVVLAGLRVADKPADDCHPYGHRRVATLVAMFVGGALIGAAVWVLHDAITSLHEPAGPGVSGLLPLGLALATIPIKEGLYQLTRWVGRRTDNVALLANAWHHRSDAFSSMGAAVGLAAVAAGGPEWAFVDSLTALLLAAFLTTAAVKIIRTSASELVDRAPSAATLADIERAVTDTGGVRSFHGFRARQIGGKITMDIHVQVDPALTVGQGHDIATAVRSQVMDAAPRVVQAIVHVEPAEDGEHQPPANRRP